MKISSANFLSSAANPKDKIISDLPQVAVVGKSNVGKSSFINYFASDGKLARVSKQPGRTKMINYFLINDNFILSDLPGYGFAKVSKTEKDRWAMLIDDYLTNESKLCYVLFLVDSRHDPTKDDMVMYNFLFKTGLPYCIIATKADKLSRAQAAVQRRRIASVLRVGEDNILLTSSVDRIGLEAVVAKIEQALVATKNTQPTEDSEETLDVDEN